MNVGARGGQRQCGKLRKSWIRCILTCTSFGNGFCVTRVLKVRCAHTPIFCARHLCEWGIFCCQWRYHIFSSNPIWTWLHWFDCLINAAGFLRGRRKSVSCKLSTCRSPSCKETTFINIREPHAKNKTVAAKWANGRPGGTFSNDGRWWPVGGSSNVAIGFLSSINSCRLSWGQWWLMGFLAVFFLSGVVLSMPPLHRPCWTSPSRWWLCMRGGDVVSARSLEISSRWMLACLEVSVQLFKLCTPKAGVKWDLVLMENVPEPKNC